MWNRNGVLMVCAAVAGTVGAVWACGPDFPSQLLDRREASLRAAPRNSFAWEATHLLPATDPLQANESAASPDDSSQPVDAAASQGLTPAQWQRVVTLRKAADGNQAYEDGKDLPEDLRLYVAGAVDYAAAKPDLAIDRFEQVLALPPDQAALRSVWSAYSLGLVHAQRAHAAFPDRQAFQQERDAAATAFQLTRTRALAGASDTEALAVASFGEEARLYLFNDRQQCSWSDLHRDQDRCGAGIPVSDLKHAIALYAAQAGHDSGSAVQSLATLAANVLRDPRRAAALLDDPLAQRLLVAYALARLGDDGTRDAGTAGPPPIDPVLPALVHAIERQGLAQVAGADRLAALAYHSGQYDVAATLAAKAPSPLASWVAAKLALHRGDLAAAAAAYADAARAFPTANDPQAAIEPGNVPLIVGEQGVLALARGEYVEAMGHLYAAAERVGGDGNTYGSDEDGGIGYANDAFYVAERVLTIEELKAFVDKKAAATPAPAVSKDKDHPYDPAPLADRLRWLLARRLMRAGRYEEAQAYFPASGDWRFGAVDLRAKAREYAAALRKADSAWTAIDKAQARYAAALIARQDGMQLLGFEQAPDYAGIGGSFQGGSGQSADSLKQSLVTAAERRRFGDSAATLERRFHYRYLAADEALAAADLVPPRSQAFAAVLCKAAHWMREGPPDYQDHYRGYGETEPVGSSEAQRRFEAYHARYVRQGAYVKWNDNFGAACQEPDFERARQLVRHQRLVQARHVIRHYLPYEVLAVGVVLGAPVLWWLRRRAARDRGKTGA